MNPLSRALQRGSTIDQDSLSLAICHWTGAQQILVMFSSQAQP
jgi:hypothetical protein